MIAIIDYGAGNIKSVEKAFLHLGKEVIVTDDRSVIMNAEKAVLPGVGSFGDAMERLRETGLDEVIYRYIATEKPLLGICLGLQLLFEESEETPGVKGLGILKGKIRRFPDNGVNKIPQIGWNTISINPESRLFKGIKDNSYVYFVHSYYLEADDKKIISAVTEYITEYHSAIENNNIYACQFHPEKSSDTGLKILSNFAEL